MNPVRIVVTCLAIFTCVLCSPDSKAQSPYFPPISGNAWDSISPASLNWCQPEIDSLLTYLDDENSKAFIVLKGGKIVIEEYFGSFERDSNWIWFSAGKTLTALLAGIAQQEGDLLISNKTSDYLGTGWTSLDSNKENLITVRHQLTMTSGLDETATVYCTLDTCLQYAADAGTRWFYHNPPYSLLRNVIEAATGTNYNVYNFLKLQQRTGMNGLWLPVGYNNFYFSTARSMARFGLLMQNNAVWNGDSIITDPSYYNDMINTSQSLNPSYGYLWWLNGKSSHVLPGLSIPLPGSLAPDAPADMYVAAGANGQFICISPGLDLVVVRIGNESSGSPVPTVFLNEIWKRLNDVFCSTVGTAEFEGKDAVEIFPNPAHNILNISSAGKIANAEIFDLKGKMLSHFSNPGSTLDISDLEAGQVYLIRITSEEEIYVRRFLK